jgi:hypothetical protein
MLKAASRTGMQATYKRWPVLNRRAMQLLHHAYIEDFSRLAALDWSAEKPPQRSYHEIQAQHGTVMQMSRYVRGAPDGPT